jgi:hypothetical protein
MFYALLPLILAIYLISGLLAINLIRNKLKKSFPALSDDNLDKMRLYILLVGLLITTIQLYRSATKYEELSTQNEATKSKLSSITEYGEVAHLAFDGMYDMGGGVRGRGSSPATSVVHGWWGNYEIPAQDGCVSWRCDEEAVSYYKQVIEKQPRYPFPYWLVADCLIKQNHDSWKAFAESGIAILEQTTKVAGHEHTHDLALKELRELVSEKTHP